MMDATASTLRTSQLAVIAGSAMAMIGSLLPWATLTSPFGTVSMNGTDGDGVLTLILAAFVGVVAWLRADQQRWCIAALTGCAAMLLIGISDVISVSDRASQVSGMAHGSVGIGLYIMLIGTVLAAVALIVHMRSQ